MKVYIGCDHKGVECKEKIINYLKSNDIKVYDTLKKNEEYDDYPDFAVEVCQSVLNCKENALGILICNTGIGMSIVANKINGIYCARIVNENEAFLAKDHNGANVIAISAMLPMEKVEKIVDTFIATKFPTEERHLRRINKVKSVEKNNAN